MTTTVKENKMEIEFRVPAIKPAVLKLSGTHQFLLYFYG